MQEVEVLRRFDHPNIIKYHDCAVEGRHLHIFMEHAERGELYQVIQERARLKRPFGEEEVMRCFVQIAVALDHVHSKNILHRDLKSRNIFCTATGALKLGDFGIARVLSSESECAHTAIGTPYYLSPEICEDKPYGRKSDVWALGCILYELATLRHAFDGQSLPALVLKILRGKYPPIPAQYSPKLRALVDAMLKRRPQLRPSVAQILTMPYVKAYADEYCSLLMSARVEIPGAEGGRGAAGGDGDWDGGGGRERASQGGGGGEASSAETGVGAGAGGGESSAGEEGVPPPELSPEPEMNTRDRYKQQMLEDSEVRRSREEWVADREAELLRMQAALAQQQPPRGVASEEAVPLPSAVESAAGPSRPAPRERDRATRRSAAGAAVGGGRAAEKRPARPRPAFDVRAVRSPPPKPKAQSSPDEAKQRLLQRRKEEEKRQRAAAAEKARARKGRIQAQQEELQKQERRAQELHANFQAARETKAQEAKEAAEQAAKHRDGMKAVRPRIDRSALRAAGQAFAKKQGITFSPKEAGADGGSPGAATPPGRSSGAGETGPRAPPLAPPKRETPPPRKLLQPAETDGSFPEVEIYCPFERGPGDLGGEPRTPPPAATAPGGEVGYAPQSAPSPQGGAPEQPEEEAAPRPSPEALGQRIEHLRMGLENDLGDTKLIEVYTYLRGVEAGVGRGDEQTQVALERMLGPDISRVRTIHKLMLLEDALYV